MIKKGTIVDTPHGKGVVVDEEVYRTCERWGVRLDDSPFTMRVAYYFKNEVTECKTDEEKRQ